MLSFGFIYLLHFSVTVFRLTSENKRLAQELDMLTKLVEERKPEDGADVPVQMRDRQGGDSLIGTASSLCHMP